MTKGSAIAIVGIFSILVFQQVIKEAIRANIPQVQEVSIECTCPQEGEVVYD